MVRIQTGGDSQVKDGGGKREDPQIRMGWPDFEQGEILRLRMEVGKGGSTNKKGVVRIRTGGDSQVKDGGG